MSRRDVRDLPLQLAMQQGKAACATSGGGEGMRWVGARTSSGSRELSKPLASTVTGRATPAAATAVDGKFLTGRGTAKTSATCGRRSQPQSPTTDVSMACEGAGRRICFVGESRGRRCRGTKGPCEESRRTSELACSSRTAMGDRVGDGTVEGGCGSARAERRGEYPNEREGISTSSITRSPGVPSSPAQRNSTTQELLACNSRCVVQRAGKGGTGGYQRRHRNPRRRPSHVGYSTRCIGECTPPTSIHVVVVSPGVKEKRGEESGWRGRGSVHYERTNEASQLRAQRVNKKNKMARR